MINEEGAQRLLEIANLIEIVDDDETREQRQADADLIRTCLSDLGQMVQAAQEMSKFRDAVMHSFVNGAPFVINWEGTHTKVKVEKVIGLHLPGGRVT